MFVKHLPDQDGIEIVVSVPQVVADAPDVPPRLAGTQCLSIITESLCRLADDQECILRREQGSFIFRDVERALAGQKTSIRLILSRISWSG